MGENIGLTPGTMLHGAYRIERILGQGGFGITYLAYEVSLERYVAIKEFFPKDYCDREATTSQVTLGTGNTRDFVETLKAKFLREAKYIAKLDHPGVIKIHTAFEENQTAYYVMDFIEGSTLSQLIRKRMEERRGPLPEKEALRYIRMVGEALEYVHSHSMNHFDVKPANILVRKADDRPVLIDFGLSRQYDESSKQATATVMGMSQGYAPMEQYVAGGVKGFSPQTDLYALAATLYFLLAGSAPPDAPSLTEQELTFPATVPPRLIDPISKGMASRRQDRQESVRAFLNDLEASAPQPQRPTLPPDEEATQITFVQKPVSVENASSEQKPAPVQNASSGPALAPVKEKPKEQEEAAGETEYTPNRKYTWIWFAAAACIGLAVWLIWGREVFPDNGSGKEEGTETTTPAIQSVEGLLWESPLGKCVYSGEVMTDAETGEQIPDGKGVAKILRGEYGGSTYDGEFKKGVFEGKTVYTYRNGDTFEGTFVNNAYNVGKYTDKESGEYFEGTFKNGDPDIGTWYDRNGNKIE